MKLFQCGWTLHETVTGATTTCGRNAVCKVTTPSGTELYPCELHAASSRFIAGEMAAGWKIEELPRVVIDAERLLELEARVAALEKLAGERDLS